jgi:hypothetical protein
MTNEEIEKINELDFYEVITKKKTARILTQIYL